MSSVRIFKKKKKRKEKKREKEGKKRGGHKTRGGSRETGLHVTMTANHYDAPLSGLGIFHPEGEGGGGEGRGGGGKRDGRGLDRLDAS